jgi:hypothetical protein
MTLLEILLADLYTEHGIDLIRTTAGMTQEVEEKITELAMELTNLLQGRKLPLQNIKQVNAILAEASAAIKAQYVEIAAAHQANLSTLSLIEGSFAASSINSLVSSPIMLGVGKNRLSAVVAEALIEGAPTKQWWAKQAADATFKFSGVVRNGFTEGQTTDQIVTQIVGRKARGDQPEIKGFMDTSKRNARSLVHNSVQTVANGARMEVYKANSGEDGPVKGYRQLSTLDSHTTDICMAYDQKTWDLAFEPVGHSLPWKQGCPRHWGCRSLELPWLKSMRELGIDVDEVVSTRASLDGQVPASLNFETWLKGKSKEFQDEKLGIGRADLWRRGVITMNDLLDQRGNPLTLAQLKALYAPD